MNIFVMILTCLNILLALGLSFSVFLRVKEKKEDQRITKGLQLLQHKIAILQDLSDKADEQVQRLVHVLDHKSNELRKTMTEANSILNNFAKMSHVNTTFNMDELNQFAQAINQQNEKMKSAITMTMQNNLPQDFINPIEESSPAATSAKTSAQIDKIRPFEFPKLK